MNRVLAFLEEKFMPFAGKLAGQRHLQALRDGIILAMPFIIIGSLFLIVAYLPYIGSDPDRMYLITNEAIRAKILLPVASTFDIMALIAALGVAYRLAEKYDLDSITAAAISLAGFLTATPFLVEHTLTDGSVVEVSGAIPAVMMGSNGLFVALLIGILSTEIYRFIVKKNIVIKMPDGVPPAVSKSFVALIPGFVVVALVWVIRLIVEALGIESIHDIVGIVLGAPLGMLGDTLIGSIIAMGVVQLLWSTGLHGMNIVNSVMSPIWLQNTGENQAVYVATNGTGELPNIFTAQFFDVFVNIGGSGATLGLVILMLLWAKSKQMKQIGRLSAGPGLFMINEPVVFGVPIVLNPMLIIPFFIVPLVNVITTYVAMEWGLVAKPNGVAIPWTTPPIIGGFLATNSISGSIMQVFNIVVGFFIYLPFFKLWDNLKKKEELASESQENGA